MHRSQRKELSPIATNTSPILQRIYGIRAVLFDIYGTLLISGSGDIGNVSSTSSSSVFQHALEKADIGPKTLEVGEWAERLFRHNIATSHARSRESGIDYPEVDIVEIWRESLRALKAEGVIDAEVTCEVIERMAVAYEVTANPVFLMPTAAEILSSLRGSGYVLGIVSNAQFFTPHLLEIELNTTLAEAGFASNLCSYSYMAGCAKPSKQIFAPVLDGLRRDYGVRPDEVLYVGNDMLNDIMTAKACGCRTCLFAGDRRSLRLRLGDHRCTATHPDSIVTELGQIDHILVQEDSVLL